MSLKVLRAYVRNVKSLTSIRGRGITFLALSRSTSAQMRSRRRSLSRRALVMCFIAAFSSQATIAAETYLYCANGGEDDVSAYSIDPSTGVLTPTPSRSFPIHGIAQGIAVDPSGRFAYVSDATNNQVAAFLINASTGDLTPLPTPTYPAGVSPHGIAVDPSGKFVVVENFAAASLSRYAINASNGALTPVGQPVATGPYPEFNLTFDSTGRNLYVPGSNSGGPGSVSSYSFDSNTGALTSTGTVSAGIGSSWVVVHPSDKFAYVSNGWGNSIYGFEINPSTGALSAPLPNSPYPSGPAGRSLAMDPQGRFLFVADTGSKQIVVFKIDQTTGALSQQGAPVSGGDTGLIVDPSGNFLYAANVAAAGIYGFRIDQTTGSLTPIPGSPFRAGNEPLYFAIAAPHPTSTLAVNFFTPTHGGNTGQVTMQLYGSGFRNGATVKLTGSGPDIVGANTTLSNPSEIVTTFNLLGVNPGLRTLSISLPDATSVEITNGFMIESRGASELSLVIVGRDKIRIGTPQTFYVALQNTGIVDSGPTRVFVSLPDYLQVAQRGTADLIPAGIYSATPIQEEASHPLALLSRFATGNQTASFITGRVPAGTTQYAPIQITYPFNVATSDFTVTANQLRDLENYPTNFSDYAAQHGAQFPFVHLAGVPDRCVPLEDAAIKAYSSAESKYTALKSSQDNANQQLLLIVGSSALATMQAEVLEGIGVTELGKVALGAFVTEVRGCIYRNIEDPLNQACLPNVDELMTEVKTGAVELLASQFSEKLSEFVSYTTSAIVGLKPENVDEYNRLIAVRGSALTDFQNAFKAYMQALSKYSSCSGYTPPPPYNPFGISSLLVSPVGALDPNAKTGPSGIGASRFVAGSVPLTYNLEFGNESRATAPAQTVLITDPLPSTLAANTFTFGPITIGSHVSIPPPSSASSFGTVLDLRPDNDLLVQIDAQLDHAGRKASWKFTSIDPTTGQPPTDPTVGFLPPGASGSTSFRVNVSANTNTRVDNHAQIVFDVNPPISTAVWSNAIDALPPHSRVLPLPPNQQASCFSLQWIGSDIGAGLRSVTILASDNGGPYTAWLSNTASAAVLFTGQPGHTYSFFSQATDLVGNVEPAKNSAEATTTVEPGASCNGRPSIAGSVTSKSRNGVTERLTLQFRNTGIGNARNVSLNGIVFRTLAGTGSVTLSGPRLPISLGGPAAGASTAVTLTLTVPATVREFSINEIGTVSDEANNHYQFSIGQTVFP